MAGSGVKRFPRLIVKRIARELESYPGVVIVGPRRVGKASCAAGLARSVDLLDPRMSVAGEAAAGERGVAGSRDVSGAESGLELLGLYGESDVRVRCGTKFVNGVLIDPSVLLHGAEPHLICDLWMAPAAEGAVRAYAAALAEAGTKGALLATNDCDTWGELGESGGLRGGRSHGESPQTLALLRMLPLSLQEAGVSSGSASLGGLFEGELRRSAWAEDSHGVNVITSADVAQLVCHGGWPEIWSMEAADDDAAARLVEALVSQAAEHGRLSREGAQGCAWALARCLGEAPTFERIASGMEASSGTRPSRDTVRRYLRVLEEEQVLLPVPGWTPPGRARKRVKSKSKQFFVDPSVPAALLSVRAGGLAEDPLRLQTLLANLVARDLHVYLEALGGGRVCHYQDGAGTCVDFVVERRAGAEAAAGAEGAEAAAVAEVSADAEVSAGAEVRAGAEAQAEGVEALGLQWGAIQVALSLATVDEQCRHLHSLAGKSSVPPAFLAVLCAQAVEAYRREDSVFVIPLASFGA